ncbi:hypothetical protein [Endozoicomonas sp.]|uniref:hypothetical protein n=1 Tax=Endozoicomonas sp. TaxID=1892382 RepID=UPI002887C4AA|nr:hypothetical protein [Endozoicomonas sp.]
MFTSANHTVRKSISRIEDLLSWKASLKAASIRAANNSVQYFSYNLYGSSILDAGLLFSMATALESIPLIARKLVRTEPLSSLLISDFIRTHNYDDLAWLIKNGSSPKPIMEYYIPGNPGSLNNLIKEFDIKLNRKEYHSLVTKAVDPSSVNCLKVLLQNGAPVDGDNMKPLFKAIEVGSIESLKLLVTYGLSVFKGNFELRELIFIDAFRANHTEMVAYLLTQHPFSKESFITNGTQEKYNCDRVRECRLANLINAINESCSNHIKCLMLIEAGPEGTYMLDEAGPDGTYMLDDLSCRQLFKTGQEKKLFDTSEPLGDKPVDYRNKLKTAVRNVHSKNNSLSGNSSIGN